jgi:hypothetical protein
MTKGKIVFDPAEYFDLLSSDQINVSDANFINDELIEVHFENVDEFVEADGKTNVVITAFTTAHARLKLYGVLEQLNRRVLYFDTDSVIYVSKDGEWEPPMGSYLGELMSWMELTLPPLCLEALKTTPTRRAQTKRCAKFEESP